MTTSNRYVALLRGINVGGKNKLPMRDLVGMFADAGCGDVQSYIQSGNVVFAAPPQVVKTLSRTITAAITARFGFAVPVVLRSAAELIAVAQEHPLAGKGIEPTALHVAFLADLPGAKDIARLDPQRSPGDTFLVREREVYLCLPNGVARTRLTNDYFDRTLATTSTLRNWRTVQTLRDLVVGAGS